MAAVSRARLVRIRTGGRVYVTLSEGRMGNCGKCRAREVDRQGYSGTVGQWDGGTVGQTVHPVTTFPVSRLSSPVRLSGSRKRVTAALTEWMPPAQIREPGVVAVRRD